MPIKLDISANERSTIKISVSFFDEDTPPKAVTPSSIDWTLSDKSGNIINSREDVSATPGETVVILLTGDDLIILPGEENPVRYITVSAIYDSSAGSNLSLRDQIRFYINDLLKVD